MSFRLKEHQRFDVRLLWCFIVTDTGVETIDVTVLRGMFLVQDWVFEIILKERFRKKLVVFSLMT